MGVWVERKKISRLGGGYIDIYSRRDTWRMLGDERTSEGLDHPSWAGWSEGVAEKGNSQAGREHRRTWSPRKRKAVEYPPMVGWMVRGRPNRPSTTRTPATAPTVTATQTPCGVRGPHAGTGRQEGRQPDASVRDSITLVGGGAAGRRAAGREAAEVLGGMTGG